MEGIEKRSELERAGFSEEEIKQWEAQTRKELSDAGFSGQDIEEYFGAPKPPDLAPTQKHFEATRPELKAPEVQAPIDLSRPLLPQPSGEFSTEKTITIEQDGRHYVIPTIVGGKELPEEEAVKAFQSGSNPAVGEFDTADKAQAYAQKRSEEIGKIRAAEIEKRQAVDFSGKTEKTDERPLQEQRADTFLDWIEKVWGVSKKGLKSGYQSSVTGLMLQGGLPQELLPEDAAWYARIAYQVGLLGGDAPAMIPGAVAGFGAGASLGSAVPIVGTGVGALAGAGAGAFMLPEAMRTILMEGYSKGELRDFRDFFERAAAVFVQTAKAGIVGAVTAPAGPAVGKLIGPMAGPVIKGTAETGASIITMVTVGKALEGQVPSAQDFVDAAVVLGGLKGSIHVATKLRTIYAKTGVRPDQVVQDVQSEPVLKQELLSSNIELPRKYAGEVTEPVIVKEKPPPTIPTTIEEVAKAWEGMTPKARQDFIESAKGESSLKAAAEAVEDFGKPFDQLPIGQQTAISRIFGVEPGVVETEVRSLVEPKITELPRPPESPQPSLAQRAVLDRIAKSPEKEGFTWDKLYTNTINDLHPLFVVTEELAGKQIPVARHPGKLAQLTRGAFGKADHFLEFGTFDFNTYAVTGKGLKQILEPVKNDLDGFRAYAASRRAIELEGRGIKTGFPMEQARDVVAQGEATYGRIFSQLLDYQKALVDYLKQSGLLSEEAHSAMLEANRNYVPFYRLMEEGTVPGPGKGLQARQPIKGIKGSERQILDPIESIIKNTYLYLALAERNAVGRAFIDLVEASPKGADFAKRAQRPVRPIELGSGEVDRLLQQYDVKVENQEAFSIFRPGMLTPKADEIIVYRNGKPELWEVDKDVAAAFKATDRETASWLTKILAMPAKALRAGATITPEFMVRNYSRDQLSAWIFSKGGYIPVLDFMRGAWSIFSKDQSFQNWLKSGGANAALVSIDRRYIQENVFKLDKDTGIASRAWNVMKAPLEFLRVTSELIENSTRLGEFKRVTKGEQTKEAIQTGGFSSREVTLDFARVGAKTRAMNMITAFFNAQVQGTDRAIRAFGENPVGTSAKIAAGITLPSIMLWWVNHDDPRWKEIPQWQRDLFWIVMTDEHIYRIPKPFEMGIMFGSVPERILDAYYAENPDAFKNLEGTMLNAFMPNLMPTAAVPILEQVTNYSFFRDTQLVPQRLEDLLPEYQYQDYTSELTKTLGGFVGSVPALHDKSIASPIVIENYIRQWTGGMGTYVIQIADAALRRAGVLPDPVKPAATLADIPIIKAFAVRYPSAQAESIQTFYDRYEKADRILKTIKQLAAEGDIEAMNRELNIGEDTMFRLNEAKNAMSAQHRMISLIYKNPGIPPEEKRQLIDAIYYQMIEVAKSGNALLDAVEGQLAH